MPAPHGHLHWMAMFAVKTLDFAFFFLVLQSHGSCLVFKCISRVSAVRHTEGKKQTLVLSLCLLFLYSLILIKNRLSVCTQTDSNTLFSVAEKSILISILSKVSEYIIVISCDEFLTMASCSYITSDDTLKAFIC